ncbi:MAG: PAP2 family protein, partial [Draconibacterium sp.]|nr:PAP2 family protein [Draconibacterium sp.]
MAEKISKFISVIFHPVLIPTLGFFLLFNSGFYFSMLSWEAERFVLLVVLFSTGILPVLSIAILALNPKFDLLMENSRDRIIPLLSSSVFYYLGFVLLGRMKAFPVFKLFLVASVLVIIAMLLISFKWKIS